MKDGKTKRKEYKELAQHISYLDTLKNQTLLRKRIEDLRRHNNCLKPSERTAFLEELSKALFGQGTLQKVYLNVEHGRLQLYENLHVFGENLAYLHTNRIKLEYNNRTYEIDISILWDAFLDNLLVVFPFAQAEALRRSAERERYERGGALDYVPSKRY